MKKIKWFSTDKEINKTEIEQVEKIFNIIFPDDFKRCIIEIHGGAPLPNIYNLNNKEEVFDRLLSFDKDSPLYIIIDYNTVKDRLIDNIYPFAIDPFGNSICFDYHEGKDNPPKIVFWDHEMASIDPEKAITYICDSFTELLEKLYDPEEE